MRRFAVSILALLVAAAVPALAQEAPPARVGRVSFVSGPLAFHAAGETRWSTAAVNYPVATGGSFATDPQSRAEIRIGEQTIDIEGGTELDITRLQQRTMQIAVPQGRINLHLRALPPDNTVEIDIPRGAVWLMQPGIYDIDAGTQEQPSRVTVFEGSARFVGRPIDLGIETGSTAVIAGWATLSETVEPATPDAFAEWCRSRDHEQQLAAPKYVSPQMTGYEELDQYGSWDTSPDYGQVWYPNSVPDDWAPYREGYWISVAPWGWTWIDEAPWGFAPFHYGRWARIHDRWGWMPGRVVAQPVYAPALVAFIGDPTIGFAVAGAAEPAVGWFPLAPNEVYWPSYSRNPTYIRNLNVTSVNQTTINNISNAAANRPTAAPAQVARQSFANRGAATVVPVRTFASSAKVAPAAIKVPPQTLQQAPVTVRPPQATPAAARVAPPQPAAGPTATTPTVVPGAHSPGAPVAAAPTTAPGAHPPGPRSAAAPAVAPAASPHPVPPPPPAAAPVALPHPTSHPAVPPHPASAAPPAAPVALPHPASPPAAPPHLAPPPAAVLRPAAPPVAPPHPAAPPAAVLRPAAPPVAAPHPAAPPVAAPHPAAPPVAAPHPAARPTAPSHPAAAPPPGKAVPKEDERK